MCTDAPSSGQFAYRLTCALCVSVAIGAAITEGLRAQAKPPVYVVGEIEVTDPATYKTYSDGQSTLVPSFGGQFLTRGTGLARLATIQGTSGSTGQGCQLPRVRRRGHELADSHEAASVGALTIPFSLLQWADQVIE